ncbi:MAG: riboflavin synthase [Cellvibrionales bacterium TMED49]|nr:riboflavin synthase [Porticoccaceae bacterium]OUU37943.1 MAG: riboflavin synthase [Cellvibrionales bacterium TMED49]
MFTGIISSIGKIESLQKFSEDIRLGINANDLGFYDLSLGDSVACSGVCLTVIDLSDSTFFVDVSRETLSLTTIGYWKIGDRVNLEKAMQATDRFGGHIVSGHVDGMGEITERRRDARSEWLRVRAPRNLAKYIARKGSITVDGTSLTVNRVDGNEFELNIIPQTLTHTVIDAYREGTSVNLEVDLVARYLERLLLGESAAKHGDIDSYGSQNELSEDQG